MAEALHCPSCGAAVGSGDIRCPYCHSQLATVACPRCLAMVPLDAAHCPRCGAEIHRSPEEAASDLACPGCKAKLFHASVGEAHLDQCHACGGVWVAQPEFDKMASDREERGEVLGVLPGEGPKGALVAGEVRYRPCPLCGKLMNRINYAHVSGVIVDVCKDHGIWFDRDELRRVLTFIQEGGLEKSRERELRQLEDERRMAATSLPETSSWGLGAAQERPDGLLDRLIRGFFGI